MFKNFKKSISCILMAIILILSLFPTYLVNADTVTSAKATSYVVLGDSIAYGMSAANNEGYNVMFYNYLKTTKEYKNLTFTNLSKPGDTSSDLVKKLKTKEFQEKIANADIINISVAGNNFLGPVESSIAKLFNVDNPNGDAVEEAINKAVKKDPLGTYLKLSRLLIPSDSASKDFKNALQNGANTFISDWAIIIPTVRSLAPNATIYVNTLYNIFSKSDTMSSSLYSIMENLVSGSSDAQGINNIIKNTSKNCKIIDVHNLFANYSGDNKLIGFDINKSKFDPHPTEFGHKLIFESMLTHVTSVSIDKTSKKLTTGDKLQLKSKVQPIDATNPDTTWSSSNNNVATIGENGLLTTKSKGNVTITATTIDGNKKSTLSLNVTSSAKNNDNIFIIIGIIGSVIIILLCCFVIIFRKNKKIRA